MSRRSANSALSKENESYVKQGWYPSPTTGRAVDLTSLVNAAKQRAVSYDVASVHRLLSDITSSPSPNYATVISVTAESSSAAAERLASSSSTNTSHPVAVLNFASARNPGGGYLGGATAQEEDICRSSALYTTLLQAPDFYASHQKANGLYSHRMVYSPIVPMYRSATPPHSLLPAPYTVDFITSAAPNVGALEKNNRDKLPLVPSVLRERAARILAVCAKHGAKTLVLGAWGCGVFKNDPKDVARTFNDLLKPGASFHGRFEAVVFAIYDTSKSQSVMNSFNAEFGTNVASTPRPFKPSRPQGSASRNTREKGSPPPKDTGTELGNEQEKKPAYKMQASPPDTSQNQAKITSFFQAKPRDR